MRQEAEERGREPTSGSLNRSPPAAAAASAKARPIRFTGVFPSSVSWAETAFQTLRSCAHVNVPVNRTRTVKSGFHPRHRIDSRHDPHGTVRGERRDRRGAARLVSALERDVRPSSAWRRVRRSPGRWCRRNRPRGSPPPPRRRGARAPRPNAARAGSTRRAPQGAFRHSGGFGNRSARGGAVASRTGTTNFTH